MLIKSASAVSLFDTARMVCGAGSIKLSGVRPSVRPPVCLITRPPHASVAGSLLSAVQTEDIDRQLRPQQQRRRSTAHSSKQCAPEMRAVSR